MYRNINFCEFCDAFRDMGRNEQFSYEGKRVLFDYLEEMESATGEDMELDVIAICCEFSEDSPEDIADMYSIDLSEFDPDTDDENIRDHVIEYLENETMVAGYSPNGIVYMQF